MGETKKVKSTGRYGSRYGRGIRQRVLKIEAKQKKKHKCPYCGFPKVKRLAAGLYECRKCDAKFAGGAYIPVTMSGSVVQKMISQKSFLPHMTELIGVSEKPEEAKEEAEKKEEKPEKKKKPKK